MRLRAVNLMLGMLPADKIRTLADKNLERKAHSLVGCKQQRIKQQMKLEERLSCV